MFEIATTSTDEEITTSTDEEITSADENVEVASDDASEVASTEEVTGEDATSEDASSEEVTGEDATSEDASSEEAELSETTSVVGEEKVWPEGGVDSFKEHALPALALGMLGIFLVLGLIAIATISINKLFPAKKKDDDNKSI